VKKLRTNILRIWARDASAQTSSGGAVSAHLVNQARADAAKALDQSPRRRGRPPKDPSASGGDQRALQAQVNAEIARQLDALHEPKAWAALCCFPADTMLTITGRKHWETSPQERETVGATGSALARTLMITNPRALAALMFGAAMLNMYMPRAIQELKYLRNEKAKEEKGDGKEPAK
jgi:hypothetical protein